MERHGKRFGVSVTLFFLVLALLPGLAAATTRAVVVGVTDYPALDKKLWLQGPLNDAEMMVQVLTQHAGATDIHLLTEHTPKSLPTRANILAALDAVTAAATKGDTVVVYFAGHGSQQPAANADDEKDGLDEIFLPRDAAKWNKEIGGVENAIVDNEVGRYVDRLRNKGAFVLALFDSCHSETMTRGLAPKDVRFRDAPMETLGIPRIAEARAVARAAAVADDDRAVFDDVPESDKGGYVAFYAVQSFERAPEMPMPVGEPDAKPQGVFSYTLAQVLAQAHDATWRQVRDEVLRRYRAGAMWTPTPQMSGTALDQVVFSDAQGGRRDNWTLEKSRKPMEIDAGRLDGLVVGQTLAVLKSPLDGIDKAIGRVRVDAVSLTSSRVSLLPDAGGALPAMDAWPSRPVVTPLEKSVRLSLRVALPQGKWPFKEVSGAALDAALKKLQADFAGTQLEFVRDGNVDLRLVPDYVDTDASGNKYPKALPALYVAPATGQLVTEGPRHTHAVLLVDDGSGAPRDADVLAGKLGGLLTSIAKVVNLQRLSSGLGTQASKLGLDVKILVARSAAQPACAATDESEETCPRRWEPAESMQGLRLASGDLVRVALRNTGHEAVDVTVLYLDAAYGIEPMFPVGEESPRLREAMGADRPAEQKNVDIAINAETFGEERLLVIAVPGTSPEPRDYRVFAKPSEMRTRGLQDQGSVGGALDLLLAGSQDVATRGAGRVGAGGSSERAVIETVPLHIAP